MTKLQIKIGGTEPVTTTCPYHITWTDTHGWDQNV